MKRLIPPPNPNETRDWDAVWKRQSKLNVSNWDEYRFRGMLHWLPSDFHGSYLDFACGMSALPHWMRGAYPDSKISGWDGSKWAIDEMQKKYSNIAYRQVSLEDLYNDRESCQFNYITCSSALSGFEEPFEALVEMHSLLKPGGVLGVVVPKTSVGHGQHVWLIEAEDLKMCFSSIFEESAVYGLHEIFPQLTESRFNVALGRKK